MSSSEQWYSEMLLNLLDEDLRISTLNEIKEHFTSLSQEEASRFTNSLQLRLVFDCLNDSNQEQINLACEVLSLSLKNLNLGEITNRYGAALERALIHPYPPVKLMALKEIERSISSEDAVYILSEKTVLMANIISCLGDDDLSVVKKASDIIISLGITIPGINKITSKEILISFQQVMSLNEITRLRIYEVVINISKQSNHSFEKFKMVGFITKILDELGNNDVLLKLNIIEILSHLALSEHGYVFLDESEILSKIFSMIEEDEMTMQLCQPGILKFFGHIGNKKPVELLSKYPKFLDRLFSNIESSDLILVGISLDTICYIGQTNQGKYALESTGNKIEHAIKTISKRLTSLPTESRVRALNCIENLLRVTEIKNDVMAITRGWYGLLGTDPMDIILRYAKNPFSELRLAGLGIINAMAGQIWGQQVIKNTPGLIEFLLDRSVEAVKECKEAKYEIVRLLSFSTIFDHSILERLQTFVKQGPFYVQALTEVAIEGNE